MQSIVGYDDRAGAPLREQSIVAALRRIIRAVDIHSRKLGQEHGLTAPQLAAMQEIERNGCASAGEIARRIHLSPGTVTGIISRLEQRGFVRRAASKVDRRRVEIRLSPAGVNALDRAPSLLQDRFRRSLGQLQDWEQQMLLAALQRIASLMDASELDASPHLTIGEVGSSPHAAAQTPHGVTAGDPS